MSCFLEGLLLVQSRRLAHRRRRLFLGMERGLRREPEARHAWRSPETSAPRGVPHSAPRRGQPRDGRTGRPWPGTVMSPLRLGPPHDAPGSASGGYPFQTHSEGASPPFRSLPPGRSASRRTSRGWGPPFRGEHPERRAAGRSRAGDRRRGEHPEFATASRGRSVSRRTRFPDRPPRIFSEGGFGSVEGPLYSIALSSVARTVTFRGGFERRSPLQNPRGCRGTPRATR